MSNSITKIIFKVTPIFMQAVNKIKSLNCIKIQDMQWCYMEGGWLSMELRTVITDTE